MKEKYPIISVRYKREEIKEIEKRAKNANMLVTRFGKKQPNISGFIRLKSLE